MSFMLRLRPAYLKLSYPRVLISRKYSVTSPKKKDTLLTIPNCLSLARLATAPVIGMLIVNNSPGAALGLMAGACVTDFFDGYIARKFKKQSALGSILDPAADKALMISLASCLTYSGIVPWWCGTAILGRDIALLISAIFVRWRSLPPPKTFVRYWDFRIPSVQVNPTTISKWNTFFQMVYLGVALASPLVKIPGLETLAILVTGTTIASGVSYLTSQSALKFIRK